MNFEVFDNGLQVVLFLIFALLSLLYGMRTQNRKFWILSGCYACFSMGTLYYLLYLVIMGKVPQVFYVSEIAWLASYLFLLALCLMLTQKEGIRIQIPFVLAAVVEFITVMGWQIFGPSYIFSAVFGIVTAYIFYCSLYMCFSEKRKIGFSISFLIVLQLMLYIVSVFMSDYTHFNLYFAVDFSLMFVMCSLFVLLKKEEAK